MTEVVKEGEFSGTDIWAGYIESVAAAIESNRAHREVDRDTLVGGWLRTEYRLLEQAGGNIGSYEEIFGLEDMEAYEDMIDNLDTIIRGLEDGEKLFEKVYNAVERDLNAEPVAVQATENIEGEYEDKMEAYLAFPEIMSY